MSALPFDYLDSSAGRDAARTRISKLDAEIESLELILRALRLQREEYRQILDTYRYPILTLPPEVTAEIFTHFIRPYPRRSLLTDLRSPLRLCRICRAWRQVAMSMPRLWNSMALTLDEPALYPQQLSLLVAWLDRSGSCPLSIGLSCELGPGASVAPFVEAIMRHASRLEDVSLRIPHEDFHLLEGPMPRLHDLTIAPSDLMEDSETLPASEIFTEAPNLRDVRLLIYFNPFRVTLPWSQITHLEAESFFDTEAAAVLRHATALEYCEFQVSLILLSEPIPAIPPLEHLRFFSFVPVDLEGDSDTPHTSLFQALTLPALEEICVFEPHLGDDLVRVLSALRPQGSPKRIVISGAVLNPGIPPLEFYSAAFPQADVVVGLPWE